MPKKSAPKKKGARGRADEFRLPPPEIVDDMLFCLTQFADSVEKRPDVLSAAPMDVPSFGSICGNAAFAFLKDIPNFDAGVLAKLQSGETLFLMPEVAAIARTVVNHARAAGPEQLMLMMMTGMGVMEAAQLLIDEVDEQLGLELPKQPKTDEIYQFKITLAGVEPTVWRRIQIADCTLADLHYLIQAAMGWEDAHLYEFQVNRKRYMVPLNDDLPVNGPAFAADPTEDPNQVLVSELLPTGRKQLKIKYLYDFGDDWWHEVRFEKRITPAAKVEYPICTEGAGACPPEDSGGPWGYLELLEAVADQDHRSHEQAREWLGDNFDPQAFDLQKTTAALRRSAAYVEPEPGDDDADADERDDRGFDVCDLENADGAD